MNQAGDPLPLIQEWSGPLPYLVSHSSHNAPHGPPLSTQPVVDWCDLQTRSRLISVPAPGRQREARHHFSQGYLGGTRFQLLRYFRR